MKLNVIIIRDIIIPPGVNEYVTDLTIGQRVTLLDIFSRYDQTPLTETSRDLTTFATIIRLFRIYTLL